MGLCSASFFSNILCLQRIWLEIMGNSGFLHLQPKRFQGSKVHKAKKKRSGQRKQHCQEGKTETCSGKVPRDSLIYCNSYEEMFAQGFSKEVTSALHSIGKKELNCSRWTSPHWLKFRFKDSAKRNNGLTKLISRKKPSLLHSGPVWRRQASQHMTANEKQKFTMKNSAMSALSSSHPHQKQTGITHQSESETPPPPSSGRLCKPWLLSSSHAGRLQ